MNDGIITNSGLSQLASLKKNWLESKQVALGSIVDNDVEELDYPGYARQELGLEVVELVNGKLALRGWVSFPGPTSEGEVEYQVVYLVADGVITHEYRFEAPVILPPFAKARYQLSFQV